MTTSAVPALAAAQTSTDSLSSEPQPAQPGSAVPPLAAPAEDRVAGFGLPRTELPAGSVSLTGGAPGADALPLGEIRRAAGALVTDPSALVRSLQYSSPEGIPGLRNWIAQREGTASDGVLVTNGAFHSLSLVFDALLTRGDTVLVENPSYPLVFRALQYKEPSYAYVNVLEGGRLDLPALEGALKNGLRPKIFYTVPDFQNPTGGSIPAEQRLRLVELAEHYGFVIVSDSPYRELRFSGEHIPDYTLRSDRVVHVNTFSKTLGPGFRLGWVVAPAWLRPAVLRLRSNQDQHSSNVLQNIVEQIVVTQDVFDSIVSHAATQYHQRSVYLAGRLAAELGAHVLRPEGGIFLWARLPNADTDVAAARERARALGTDFVPGRYFFQPEGKDDAGWLRLGFSHLSQDSLADGADRLIAALGDAGRRP